MKPTAINLLLFLGVSIPAAVAGGQDYCDVSDPDCDTDHMYKKLRNKMVVAAIDFGTTYSGWAYQGKHQYRKDPTDIKTSKWGSNDILSKKTPTTVLIRPDGETLEAFGYNAENKYLALAADEKHRDYYYFRRFKMMLYDKKNLNKETMLKDDKGLELPAITVFSLAIGFLKDNLLDDLKKTDKAWSMEDIHWVLTVPAIWNDTAKQFMRKSAVAAGIENEDLSIALEPEAASLYCRMLPIEKNKNEKGTTFVNNFQPGRKYMVLDAGGGTIDITVHEVVARRRLKELHKASGGPWGGTKVDFAFENMWTTLVGENVYQQFKKECPYDYLDLMRSFERIKRSIDPTNDDNIPFRYPQCLDIILNQVTGTDMNQRISLTFKSSIGKRYDKLKLKADFGRSFFEDTVDSIVTTVKDLLEIRAIRDIDTILMVGGFSDSSMLQHAIQFNFGHKLKILIPEHPELAIVNGAVMFGFNPSVIEERIAKFTYGVQVLVNFKEDIHDQKEKVEIDGKLKCDNLFSRLVKIGDKIRYNEIQGKNVLVPVSARNRNMYLPIYECSTEDPMYIKDESCSKIGSITIDIHDTSVPVDKRTFLVEFIFSYTEIKVAVTEERTGKRNELFLDFES